jgi:hypothetical protein
MELAERRNRHARRTELLPCAGDRIEHPLRDHDDHTGRRLDVNKPP